MRTSNSLIRQTAEQSPQVLSSLSKKQSRETRSKTILRVQEPDAGPSNSNTAKKNTKLSHFRIKSKTECHSLSHSRDTSSSSLARPEEPRASGTSHARRPAKEGYYKRHNMVQNHELKDIISHMYKLDSIKNSKRGVNK